MLIALLLWAPVAAGHISSRHNKSYGSYTVYRTGTRTGTGTGMGTIDNHSSLSLSLSLHSVYSTYCNLETNRFLVPVPVPVPCSVNEPSLSVIFLHINFILYCHRS